MAKIISTQMDTIEASNGLKMRWHDSNPFKLMLAKMPDSISVQWEKRQNDFLQHISMEALSLRMIIPISDIAPMSVNKELEKTLLSSKGMGSIRTKKLLDEIDRVAWEIDKEPLNYGYPSIQEIIRHMFPHD